MILSSISVYPIKSLKGISLRSAKVEDRGLEFDRRWMLTTPDGMFFTQREFPRMATIAVAIENGELRVENDGHGVMSIPFEPDRGRRQQVTVWQSVCEAEVYDGEVGEWFSDVLKTNCQLVRMPDLSRRHINPRFDRGDDIVSFADGYPLMVLGEASLDDLNRRLREEFEREGALPPRHRSGDTPPNQGAEAEQEPRPFEPLPMNRFRPNLVVADSDAYAEDGWRSIRVGEARITSTKPCERCVITTVEQSTGEFHGKEPLKTLASYRQAKTLMPERVEPMGLTPNAVLFGQNLVCDTPGATLNLGDEIEVLDRF